MEYLKLTTKLKIHNLKSHFKGTVISIDPPCKEGSAKITTVPSKPLTVHLVERSFCLSASKLAWIHLIRCERCVRCVSCVQSERKQLIGYCFTTLTGIKVFFLIYNSLQTKCLTNKSFFSRLKGIYPTSLINQMFKVYHYESRMLLFKWKVT